MPEVQYHDLARYGLPLVTPDTPGFDALVRDIQSRPQPFGSWPIRNPDTAAVLLNQSGKAIVALANIWRYAIGRDVRTSRFSNLGSSA